MEGSIKVENGTNVHCFVPNCRMNKKTVVGNPIHFFRVPQGNEGLRWKVAVNSNRSQYDKSIRILRRSIPQSTSYCCEVHFNIETDGIVSTDANGTVECNIKPGILPAIIPTRSKRLWEILGQKDREADNREPFPKIDYDITGHGLLQPLYTVEPNKDSVSIIDMSTWICRNSEDNNLPYQDFADDDGQIDIKFKPMMPLTIELMRRKSLYYMGLEQSLFFRLLHIINSTTSVPPDSLVEVKLMLSLRKQHLNEQFEVLGDLFDIDKTTAQDYYTESKNLVSSLYHSLASPVCGTEPDDVKNPLCIEDHQSTDDDQSSSDLGVPKYKGDVDTDSDVVSDDFSDELTTDESDELVSSELESDELDGGKKVVTEKVKCPLCGLHVGRLENHMQVNHLNPQYLNKTACGLCFKKFTTHKQLLSHQTQMHNGASCICDVCEKSFAKFSGVKEHILKVHSRCRPYLCDLCGTSYFSLSKLKIHTENVHLQIRSHVCELCAKKYFQAKELEAHIRATHTKERPFQCRLGCGKSFCRSGSRYTHEQMHKTKFVCEICSKVFSFRHNLLTHCKNIHGKNVIDMEKCKIEIQQ